MGLTDQSSLYYDSFTNYIDRWRCYAIHSVKQKGTTIYMFDIIKKMISKYIFFKVVSEVLVAQNAIKAITLHLQTVLQLH